MLKFVRKKSSNIFVSKHSIKVQGSVRGYQTYLDQDGKDTGKVVRGTSFKDRNVIEDDIKAYLSYKIGTDTTDQALDDLFTTEVEADEVGNDGITFNPAVGTMKPFVTVLNSGGDNTETYIEFYGYRTHSGSGTYQLTGYLRLGFNLAYSDPDYTFTKTFATYSINTGIEVDRRYHFYWKLSFA